MWDYGPIHSAKTRRYSGVARVSFSANRFGGAQICVLLYCWPRPLCCAEERAPFFLLNFPLSLPYLVLGRLI